MAVSITLRIDPSHAHALPSRTLGSDPAWRGGRSHTYGIVRRWFFGIRADVERSIRSAGRASAQQEPSEEPRPPRPRLFLCRTRTVRVDDTIDSASLRKAVCRIRHPDAVAVLRKGH